MIKLFRFPHFPGKKRLKTGVCSIAVLTDQEIAAMFRLMQVYYAHMEESEFLHDLRAKDEVIILREADSGSIVGFSTLKYFDLSALKAGAYGVFSGDTIVDQRYWGATALQKTFLWHLSRWKMRHRGQKLYWFLISKGYKTYLLMANNFPVHYPRYEEETPVLYQQMMDLVYRQLYPETYRSHDHLILNAGKSYHLKEGVAVPSPSVIQSFPRIRYFVEKNKHWQEGDELACIAEMNLKVLGSYLIKAVKKAFHIPRFLGIRVPLRKRRWQNAG